MTRSRRLLTLAYKAHQRGEREIASRIAILAFSEPDAADLLEEINSGVEIADEHEDTIRNAEAILRKAEALAEGGVFTAEGAASLLAIAEKVHKAGLPKVARSIVRVAD
jgi:hypothetical protein